MCCTYREETFQYVDEWNNSNGDRTAYSYTRAAGHRKYELSNHLGNVLATVTDRKIFTHIKGDCKDGKCPIFEPDIASGTDYTPFGLAMAGRTYRSKGYRYGFNGKENDSDGEWGRGLIQDYGFRLYNPAASRFLSVDPLRMSFPWNSVYAFAENDVVSCIDLDGLEKVSIHAVSFAPFDQFGGGYHGDGNKRKFGDLLQTEVGKENYRMRAEAVIDLQTEKLVSLEAHGSISKWWPAGVKAFSEADFDSKNYKDRTLKFHLASNNDAMLWGTVSPDIDLKVQFTYSWDKEKSLLNVLGNVKGDAFPSHETYITDQSGNKMFLGVSGAYGSPFTHLWGSGNVGSSEFSFSIEMNPDGNFGGVKFGGNSYSMEEWNNKFTSLDPQDGRVSTIAKDSTFSSGY